VKRAWLALAVCLAVAFCTGPFLWQVLTSLRPESELTSMGLPSALSLESYRRAFAAQALGRALWNSFLVAGTTTALCLFVGAAAAFALAKLQIAGKRILLGGSLLASMFPSVATVSSLYLVILLIGLQRLAELMLAQRNTRRLMQEGAIEVGSGHYPLFILLHGSWLLAVLLTTPANAPMNIWLLAALLLLQVGRVWVIVSLGRYWTTRIITMPGRKLVRKGPYRFIRHPNYWIVLFEIAVLPLMFGNWPVAMVWSVANVALLAWRVRVENKVLDDRTL